MCPLGVATSRPDVDSSLWKNHFHLSCFLNKSLGCSSSTFGVSAPSRNNLDDFEPLLNNKKKLFGVFSSACDFLETRGKKAATRDNTRGPGPDIWFFFFSKKMCLSMLMRNGLAAVFLGRPEKTRMRRRFWFVSRCVYTVRGSWKRRGAIDPPSEAVHV